MKDKKVIKNNENKAKVENTKIEALIPDTCEPKIKNFGLFIIIGIIILVIFAFVGLIAIGCLVYENTLVVDDVEDKEVVEELIVTDEMKFAVSNKLYKLLGGQLNPEYNSNNIYYYSSFNSSLLNGGLSDDIKQSIALKFCSFKKDDTNKWLEHENVKNILILDPKTEALEYHGTVSLDEYKKIYLDLFGETAKEPIINIGTCPEYLYSDIYKEFYNITYACGIISHGNYISYISEYELNEDTIDLYINFGFIESDYNSKSIIYGNFEEVEQDGFKYLSPINIVEEIDLSLTDSYVINETNRDKFSEYKFTFKIKDNNYFYEKVEKIK